MWLYIIIFFIPVFAYFYRIKSIRGYKGMEQSLWFLAVTMFCLSIFVGISDMLGGYDRYIYGWHFDDTADQIVAGFPFFYTDAYSSYFNTEPGYGIFYWLIAHITTNRYIYILLTTMIMYIMIWFNFKKYAINYPLAMIIFMALVFFFTFTYLRQMLSAAITCFSIKYIIDRKLWKYVLVMLLAYTFHKSAIVFFPMYFIPIKKFSQWGIIWVMAICFIIGISGISSSLYDAYAIFAEKEEMVGKYSQQADSRIAYIIEAAFFLYFLLRSHKYVDRNDKQAIVLYNISLGFCAILLFFLRSTNGGRLSWYFVYGLIFTLTNLATRPFGRKMKMDLLLMIVSLGLFVRILFAWNILLFPYKTFFTDGHREGDAIYDAYEYDMNYDKDKFYRPAFGYGE
jgi:hypothetical protein